MTILNSSALKLLGNESFNLLEKSLSDSIRLGNEARAKFQLLSNDFSLKRNKIKKTDLPKTVSGNLPLIFNYLCDFLIANEKVAGKNFNNWKQWFIDGAAMDYDLGLENETEINQQSRTFNFCKGDGKYAVREMTYNDLLENCSRAHSLMIIENLSNGLKLDLGQLLPMDNTHFSPASMFTTTKDPQKLDLSNYAGTGKHCSGDDDFAYGYSYCGPHVIKYGNLIKKSGMLGLLHEIAHAWHGSVDYAKLFEKLFQAIRRQGYGENFRCRTFRKIDLIELAENILISEARAWSDAISVVRFLSCKGFDLEPDMDNKEMVEYANTCLDTYKEYVVDSLEFRGIKLII